MPARADGLSRFGPLRAGIPPLLLLLVVGCGLRSQEPPQAGFQRGGVPELSGQRVMVLPLQRRTGVHADLQRELEYALGQAGERVDWVWSGDLESSLQSNPGVGIRLEGLPIGAFLAGELERIGDPLFGDLYRLGVLVGAPFALLPLEARVGAREAGELVELSAALLDTRSGRVLWFGIVEGGLGEPGALPQAASAAEALTRRIIF